MREALKLSGRATTNSNGSKLRPQNLNQWPLFSVPVDRRRVLLRHGVLGQRTSAPVFKQFQARSSGTNQKYQPGDVRDWFFENQNGLSLEVKSLEHSSTSKPVLLFIHGAAHGAWCWQEYFMPYFYAKGFSSHAISLRGQGRSSMPPGGKSGGTLDDHSEDISFFIEKVLKKPPIMVGHSFGGLISQAYALRDYRNRQPLQALALLAASPPIGSNSMIKRFFTRRPIQAIVLTWSFVRKSYLKSASGAKRLFFSKDMPDETAERFLGQLRKYKSKCPAVDVSKIKEVCPLPAANSSTPPVLVMGGTADFSVDREGFQETADFYGVQPVILPDLAHDLMLDTRWELAAEKLLEWITALPSLSTIS